MTESKTPFQDAVCEDFKRLIRDLIRREERLLFLDGKSDKTIAEQIELDEALGGEWDDD